MASSTPEGKVKDAVKDVLKKHGAFYRMPVPFGYGDPELDFHGHINGQVFYIETKRAGKRPTKRQQKCIRDMQASNGVVFVIDGTNDVDTLEDLENWLCEAQLIKSVPRGKR